MLGLAEGTGQTFSEDPSLMWHPEAGGLAKLHEEGKVSVFPAVGYNPQDESHFTSRHYWEVGQLDTNTRTGWIGRFLDATGEPGNPLQGLSLDYSLAPALATAKVPVAAVSSPAGYNMWAYGLGEPLIGPDARHLRAARRTRGALARLRPGAQRLARHQARPRPDGPVRRPRRQADLHLARRLPRPPAANSPNGSPRSPRCSRPGCRSSAPR